MNYRKTMCFAGGCYGPQSVPVKFPGQNSDNFLSVAGTLYIIMSSQKDKGKVRKVHILKDLTMHLLLMQELHRSKDSINR